MSDDFTDDDVTIALARMPAAANRRASEMGIDANQRLITIAQRFQGAETIWRVNYGLKDYVGPRGGDLVIEMDAKDGSVKNVLRGQ
jgi:hypothetical protein